MTPFSGDEGQRIYCLPSAVLVVVVVVVAPSVVFWFELLGGGARGAGGGGEHFDDSLPPFHSGLESQPRADPLSSSGGDALPAFLLCKFEPTDASLLM